MAVRTPALVPTSAQTNDPPIRAAVVRPGLVVEIGDDHAHALRREPLRDPGANPFRASRHQSGLSLEVHGGIVCRGTDNSTQAIRRTAG